MTPRHRRIGRYNTDEKKNLARAEKADRLPPREPCPTPAKVCYMSRKEAKHQRTLLGGIGKATKFHVHPYFCSCNRWHLGSVHDLDHLARIRENR